MSWKKVKLGKFIEVVSGYAFDSKQFNNRNEGLPLIRIRDVGRNTTGTYFSASYREDFLINDGALLVAMDGEFRIAEWAGGKGLLNQRVCWLKAKKENELDERYMLYALPKELKKIEDATSYVTVKHLSVKAINEIQIPLPDLPAQKHIAVVLDKADALRQQNRQLLTHYDELLQGTFIALFGDPVTNDKGWEVKKLGEVVQFLTSGSRGWAEYYSDSGSKFLRIQNVGYNKLKLDEIAYVVAPDTAEAKRTRVQANDILLSITADLGRTAVIPENFGEAYISQHLALLRLEGGINSTYISELLASEYCQRQFASANKGGVKAGLNFNDIKSINLLFPPLSLQNHFAEIVEKIEVQKEQMRVALAESEALFEGLLAGYFGEDKIHTKALNPGPPTAQLQLF